jgi:release factor glutamine methyltransferase
VTVLPDAPSVVARLRAAGCVYAEDEARMLLEAADSANELHYLVQRRCAGEPLEHVVGWASFCGERIAVAPGVFVPRRRTEFLVRQAVAAVAAVGGPRPVVVDLCCGSGAVGAALLTMLGDALLHAVDVDAAAVACARANLAPRGGHVYQGDLFDPLPSTLAGHVDLIVVNAPYVPTGEVRLLPAEARLHEPRTALDGGLDGLDVYRRVVAGAREWLAPGGRLLLEASEAQLAALLALLDGQGFGARVDRCAEVGATVVVAEWSR